MVRTYRDYLWLDQRYEFWTGNGYCATLIRGATPEYVLDALEAGPRRPTALGLADVALETANFHIMNLADYPNNQIVAVTDVGNGWTLLTQQDSGYVGIDDELMAPLIAEHEVVSHYSSVNADGRFIWWRDGREQISFDTLLPSHHLTANARWQPDVYARITALINEVGGIEFDYDGTRTEFHHVEGAFALAERLTGVHIAQDVIDRAPFTVAVVPTTPIDQRPPRAQPIITGPLLGETATWAEVTRLHQQTLETTIHGHYRKTDHQSGGKTVHLEFWHKPFQSWRLHDDHGVFFLQNRRQELWFRNAAGTLDYEVSGSFPAHPSELIGIDSHYDDPLATLLAPDTPGNPITVAGRPAWEFTPPPHWNGLTARLAFDAETGIALRWSSTPWTNELTAVDIGLDLPTDLFEGPRPTAN